jgi:hypothetical protein
MARNVGQVNAGFDVPGRLRRTLRAAAGVAALAIGLAAMAAPAAHAARPGGPPILTTDSLRYEVRGHVTPRCSLELLGSNTPRMDSIQDRRNGGTRATRVVLPFRMNCNTDFEVSLVSRNAGLEIQDASTGDTDFRTLVPYRAVVRGPADRLMLDCRSGRMGVGRRAECRDRIEVSRRRMAGEGAVEVTVDADPQPLLAGTYSDHLTLRLAPRLGD